VTQVTPALKDLRVSKVTQVTLDRQDLRDQRVLIVLFRDHKVQQVPPDRRDLQDQKAHKALKVYRVLAVVAAP
jgi:hypothetical protein